MKKAVRILILAITILFSVPLCANAAPQGYKVVKLSKKNAKKYMGIKKRKIRDEFGDYDGYTFTLYSKLRSKGYYYYDIRHSFVVKIKYKNRYYDKKYGKGTMTENIKTYEFGDILLFRGEEYDYKYAKVLSHKFVRAKGKIVFVEPSNVIGIENESDGRKRIKLRYPYDDTTASEGHYDESTGQWVIDYYYITREASDFKMF